MAFHLADFRGDAIYLDTNVLVGLVDAHSVYHAACAAFFQRAVEPARPLQLFTASLTLPVTTTDIHRMRQEIRVSGILTRDAILVVVPRLGLTVIPSDNEGFDNRQGLEAHWLQ